ncbi:MAG: helix-turn-helix domain-containing protein [Pseudonocardiaceae bacterium]
MARGPGPTVRARQLRRELKRLRNDSGLSVDEAGKRAGMSGPTLSRFESAKRGISVDETEKLLDTYRVPVPQQREYLEMAERANLYLEEDDEITAYQDTASTLQRSALGAGDSVTLIEQILREMA